MKKINWNIFNTALWVELILSYILPFKATDGFRYEAGFPIPFITVYNTEISTSPLMSTHLNPLGLILNSIIIYMIIWGCVTIIKKIQLNLI